jgi:hypothetical protein
MTSTAVTVPTRRIFSLASLSYLEAPSKASPRIATNLQPDQPKKHIFSLAQRAYTTVSDVQPSGPHIHWPNTNISNLAHTPAFPLIVGLAPVRHIAPSDIHANPCRTAEESLKKVLAVFPMTVSAAIAAPSCFHNTVFKRIFLRLGVWSGLGLATKDLAPVNMILNSLTRFHHGLSELLERNLGPGADPIATSFWILMRSESETSGQFLGR